jgi:hypothetical protein
MAKFIFRLRSFPGAGLWAEAGSAHNSLLLLVGGAVGGEVGGKVWGGWEILLDGLRSPAMAALRASYQDR